jgi:type IV fimbrial biogenesis protein FimT
MERVCACRGFTLVELLVVLGLVTFAQAWVVPALADVVHSVRVSAGAQALSDSLMRARSEAITRNGRVVVCKSPTGQVCELEAAWEQGWIIFHDANNNAALDPGEVVLHREHALPQSLRLKVNTPVSSYVSYTAYGQTKLTSGAFQAGTFTVCAGQDKRAIGRLVIVNSVGRPRMAKAKATQCS